MGFHYGFLRNDHSHAIVPHFWTSVFLNYTIPGFVLFDEQKILFQKIIFNMEIMKKIRVIGKF